MAVESRIRQHLVRSRSAALLYFLHPRQPCGHVATIQRPPLGHDAGVLTPRDLRLVPQGKTTPLPQKPRLAVAPRKLGLATFAQPFQAPRQFRQPLFQFLHLHPRPHAFVRIAGIPRLRPTPDLPPQPGPLLAQSLLGVHPIPRSVRPEARRVDGRHAQLSQSQLPRHFHYLREPIVQPPPVPSPQRTQRPVVRRLPTRQIAQPKILPDALLQPRALVIPTAYAYS